jgi:hypothetical protein
VKRRIAQYISKAENLTKIVDEQRHPGSNKVEFPHLDLFCDVKDLKRYLSLGTNLNPIISESFSLLLCRISIPNFFSCDLAHFLVV